MPLNGALKVELTIANDARVLAVFNLDGEFYVTDDQCTHGPGSLSEGDVLDADIICNFHGGAFHIPTGRVVEPPCMQALATYAVQVKDAAVWIDPAPRAAQA